MGIVKHAAGLLINMRDELLTPDDPEFESKFANLKEILSSSDELDENTLVTKIETALNGLYALRCRETIGEYLRSLTKRTQNIERAFLNIATHSEDKNIKSLAIACLGYLQYTNAIQMLSDLAVSDLGVSEEYNLFACDALGNIGTKESGEAMLKHLEHVSDWTKIDIVDALIKIGHPDFVEPLLKNHVKNCGAMEGYIALPIANFVGLEKYLSADVSDELYQGAVEILYELVTDGAPNGNLLDYRNPSLVIQNFIESTKSIKPQYWMVTTALQIIKLLKRAPKREQVELEKLKGCLSYMADLTEYAESPASLETLSDAHTR